MLLEITLPVGKSTPPNDLAYSTQRDIVARRRYRLLCLIGTYGKLEEIERAAGESGADAVLHCGNFGFHDALSLKRLSIPQLRIFWESKRFLEPRSAWPPSAVHDRTDEGHRLLQEHFRRQPMSSLAHYLLPPSNSSSSSSSVNGRSSHGNNRDSRHNNSSNDGGRRSFPVPVLTVWGREDRLVLEAFRSGALSVPNLHVLSSNAPIILNLPVLTDGVQECLRVVIYGVGGDNFLERLFTLGDGHELCSGTSGLIWYNILQVGLLLESHYKLQATYPELASANALRIFLTFAPVGRDPLLFLVARELDAIFAVSGSVRSRVGISCNAFGVHSVQSVRAFLGPFVERLEQICKRVIFSNRNDGSITEREFHLTNLVLKAVRRQASLLNSEENLKRTFMLGLPDAYDGHAILNVDAYVLGSQRHLVEGHVGVEMCSQGFRHRQRLHSAPSSQSASFAVASSAAVSNAVSLLNSMTIVPEPSSIVKTSPQSSLANNGIFDGVDQLSLHDNGNNHHPLDNRETALSSPTKSRESVASDGRTSDMAECNYSGSALFVISNVPGQYFQSEEHFYQDMLHGKYAVKTLRWYHPKFKDALRGECMDEENCMRLVQEMDGLMHVPTGSRLRCSRMGAGVML